MPGVTKYFNKTPCNINQIFLEKTKCEYFRCHACSFVSCLVTSCMKATKQFQFEVFHLNVTNFLYFIATFKSQ